MTPSRRDLFRLAGAAGAAAALPQPAFAQTASAPSGATAALLPSQPTGYVYFSDPEAALVSAMVDRLIPADERWPSASQAGVVDYLDRQLAGGYGAGDRFYRHGPWKQGTPQQGYQLPLTPAEFYRIALADIDPAAVGAFGKPFLELPPDRQDAFLSGLEKGALTLARLPGRTFFDLLLSSTIEGFFADPIYGGNRDMVGWRMVGFPGAYAQFADVVDQHNLAFDRPPVGIAGLGRDTAHRHG